MEQLDLGLARKNDPATSKAAAATSKSRWRQVVRHVLTTYGPLTDPEICRRSGWSAEHWPSIKTARSFMFKHGYEVMAANEVRDGCQVWRLVPPVTDAETGGYL